MAWKTYRLYRPRDRAGGAGCRESVPCGPMVPTQKTFRARNQDEAERKALKFSKEAELRFGIIDVRDESPINRFDILDL